MLHAMRHLGIDYGKKRIGTALSDESGTIASPHVVVEGGKGAARTIASLVQSNGVKKIIVGESRNFKGEENPLMEEITRFVSDLQKLTSAQIILEPEFMTSALAARPPQKTLKSRSPKKRETHDSSAAALILQSYLDKLQL